MAPSSANSISAGGARSRLAGRVFARVALAARRVDEAQHALRAADGGQPTWVSRSRRRGSASTPHQPAIEAPRRASSRVAHVAPDPAGDDARIGRPSPSPSSSRTSRNSGGRAGMKRRRPTQLSVTPLVVQQVSPRRRSRSSCRCSSRLAVHVQDGEDTVVGVHDHERRTVMALQH